MSSAIRPVVMLCWPYIDQIPTIFIWLGLLIVNPRRGSGLIIIAAVGAATGTAGVPREKTLRPHARQVPTGIQVLLAKVPGIVFQ